MKPPEEIPDVDWRKDNVHETFTVGQKFKMRFHRHGSVGEDAEFEIEDETIVSHVASESEYLHPEHMKKPGWTGGDAERAHWFFETQNPGTTKITVRVLFRFEVESEHVVTIDVE